MIWAGSSAGVDVELLPETELIIVLARYHVAYVAINGIFRAPFMRLKAEKINKSAIDCVFN